MSIPLSVFSYPTLFSPTQFTIYHHLAIPPKLQGKRVSLNEFLKVSGCGSNTVTEKIELFSIKHTVWV
jgi:hypothetical protein